MTVFHTAAKAGLWGPEREYQRTNVEGTRNLIAACREHGVPRIIYTSSPSVVFTGRDMENADETLPYSERYDAPYPKTKALAEQMILEANSESLATMSIRPHLIWGPGDNNLLPRIIARAKTGRLRKIGYGNPIIDPVYVDNAVEAHLQAADRLDPGSPVAGRAYFVTQGETVPTWDMINLTAQGRPPGSNQTNDLPPDGRCRQRRTGSGLPPVGTNRRAPHDPVHGKAPVHHTLV